jgi:hypothetical protein
MKRTLELSSPKVRAYRRFSLHTLRTGPLPTGRQAVSTARPGPGRGGYPERVFVPALKSKAAD